MMARKNRTMNSFTLDGSTVEKLDIIKEQLGISKGQIIDRAIKRYFKALVKAGKLEIEEESGQK